MKDKNVILWLHSSSENCSSCLRFERCPVQAALSPQMWDQKDLDHRRPRQNRPIVPSVLSLSCFCVGGCMTRHWAAHFASEYLGRYFSVFCIDSMFYSSCCLLFFGCFSFDFSVQIFSDDRLTLKNF